MAAGVASLASSMIDAAFSAYNDASAIADPIETNLDKEKPVWILGKLFQAEHDIHKLKEDILSRLWFTYRRSYEPIGEDGPTSDTGWGCMLRCGQMMFAQALMYYHLGRDWSWIGNQQDEAYTNILKLFLDSWDGEYSIHNIADMGVGEGKRVGEWFGPNTVSQVLRKLVVLNESSCLCVHVAMDNTVVLEDIKRLCKSDRKSWTGFAVSKAEDDEPVILENEPEPMETPLAGDEPSLQSNAQEKADDEPQNMSDIATESSTEAAPTVDTNMSHDEQVLSSDIPPSTSDDKPFSPSHSQTSNVTEPGDQPSDMSVEEPEPQSDPAPMLNDTSIPSNDRSNASDHSSGDGTTTLPSNSKDSNADTTDLSPTNSWHPLVLFIPLRLGLSEINPDYYSSLKAMFTLKQSLGVIGGQPNHAHFFIGFNGDQLIYLDPHTTQESVEMSPSGDLSDETYHCPVPNFMDFSSLDPSLALGFYCETEEIFDEWTSAIKELVIDRDQKPMFELCEKRPDHWPPFELPRKPVDPAEVDATMYDYGEENQIFDSSGEYELI